ncbi:MAG: Hsp20/alpha crystallin family protein [Omnitrophica WOR_2 bacterium]
MTLYISPYRRMSNLRSAMDRLMEETFANNTGERDMLLAVDVIAEDDNYWIKALVPGLEADSLQIEVLNNTVTIRGKFSEEAQEDKNYLVSELPAGSFSRLITLPTALDPAKAEANIKNGVLMLKVPKAEAHRPKSIKVTNS